MYKGDNCLARVNPAIELHKKNALSQKYLSVYEWHWNEECEYEELEDHSPTEIPQQIIYYVLLDIAPFSVWCAAHGSFDCLWSDMAPKWCILPVGIWRRGTAEQIQSV